jgi:hypothetical protein
MKQQCATCPFLEANRGKPTPTDFKCVEQNETDWYSQENIDGIWEVTRKEPIAFLSCHSTDPDYYGKEGNPIYACFGAVLMVYLHIKIFEHEGGSYSKYVKVVGKKYAMGQRAMLEKAMAIKFGVTSPLWGGMIIPDTMRIVMNEMRWPSGFGSAIKYIKENRLLHPVKKTA